LRRSNIGKWSLAVALWSQKHAAEVAAGKSHERRLRLQKIDNPEAKSCLSSAKSPSLIVPPFIARMLAWQVMAHMA
jgi:hypothetical protein